MMENSTIAEDFSILTHINAVNWELRFTKMQSSLDSLIKEMGNPQIVTNDSGVIARLLQVDSPLISYDLLGQASSLAKLYENLDFSDFMMIVGLNYYNWQNKEYLDSTISTYFMRKQGMKYESQLPFSEITDSTYGLLLYREQAEELAIRVTGITREEAMKLGSKLRMCLMEAWNYEGTFKLLGKKRGFSDEELEESWVEFACKAKYHINQKFIMAICWLSYQLEFIKIYYGERFQQIIFNSNADSDFCEYINIIQEANCLKNNYPLTTRT